jgi:hypothetical protein
MGSPPRAVSDSSWRCGSWCHQTQDDAPISICRTACRRGASTAPKRSRAVDS